MKETICVSTSIIIPMLQAAGELPAGPVGINPAHTQTHPSPKRKPSAPPSAGASPSSEEKQS